MGTVDELLDKLDDEFTLSNDDYYKRVYSFRGKVHHTIKFRSGEWWVKSHNEEYILITLITLEEFNEKFLAAKYATINKIAEEMMVSARNNIEWSNITGILTHLNVKYRYRKKYNLLYFGIYDPTILTPNVPSRDGFVVRVTSSEVVYHNTSISHSEYSIKILLNILVGMELV